jgi:hypothetical protein
MLARSAARKNIMYGHATDAYPSRPIRERRVRLVALRRARISRALSAIFSILFGGTEIDCLHKSKRRPRMSSLVNGKINVFGGETMMPAAIKSAMITVAVCRKTSKDGAKNTMSST